MVGDILLYSAVLALIVALNVWQMRRHKDGLWHEHGTNTARRWDGKRWQYRQKTDEEHEDSLRADAW